jgi:hypothetical protein
MYQWPSFTVADFTVAATVNCLNSQYVIISSFSDRARLLRLFFSGAFVLIGYFLLCALNKMAI